MDSILGILTKLCDGFCIVIGATILLTDWVLVLTIIRTGALEEAGLGLMTTTEPPSTSGTDWENGEAEDEHSGPRAELELGEAGG